MIITRPEHIINDIILTRENYSNQPRLTVRDKKLSRIVYVISRVTSSVRIPSKQRAISTVCAVLLSRHSLKTTLDDPIPISLHRSALRPLFNSPRGSLVSLHGQGHINGRSDRSSGPEAFSSTKMIGAHTVL